MTAVDRELVRVEGLHIRFPRSYEKNVTVQARFRALVQHWRQHGTIRRKKQYFQALRDISMAVRSGDVIGIIGPNGSGKTTLLRAIAGIYQPDQGKVEVYGRVSTLLSLGTGFNNNMSGRHNIYMVGHLMGMSREEIDERVDDIIKYADLGEHIDYPVKFYSNGMISRLGFAIAVTIDPDILLIDEVFSVGDLAFRKKSEETLRMLLDRAQCQLIVTHNLEFVKKNCNRAIYIRSGKIIKDGEPEETIEIYKEHAVKANKD